MADVEGIGILHLLQQVLRVLVGQGKHLVHQRGDLPRARTDGLGYLVTLLRLESVLLVGEHLRETVDDVQRRPYLMAHVTDELCLHLVCPRHLTVSLPQLFVLRQQSLSGTTADQDVSGHEDDDEDGQTDGNGQDDIHQSRHLLLVSHQLFLVLHLTDVLCHHRTPDRVVQQQ